MYEKIEKAIKNTAEAAKVEAEIAYEKAKPKIKTYIKVLILSYLVSLIITCTIIYFGITHENRDLLVIGGSLRAIFTAVILALAFPIGFFTSALINDFRTAAKGYLRFIGSLCISELAFTILATYIPFMENSKMISTFILVSVVAGLMNVAFFNKKVMGVFVSASFVFILISFFLPELPKTIDRGRGEINEAIGAQLVNKTCDDFERDGIIYGNGKNKYWYYESRKEGYRVYDGERADKVTGERTRPFLKRDLYDYCEWEKEREKIKKTQKPPEPPSAPAPEPPPVLKLEEKPVPKEGMVGNISPVAPTASPDIPKTPDAPNVPKVIPSPPKQAEPAKPKSNPYIQNYAAINRPSSCEAAVLIIDDRSRKILNGDSEEIARSLKAARVNSITNLFSEKFVSDGEFDKILRGDKSEIENLNLKEKTDYIVLGRRIVITEQETSGRQVATKINAVFEAVIISTETGEIIKKSRKKAITTNSTAGVSKENVIKAALEKLAEEITQEIEKDYKNRIRASFIETSSLFY